MFLNFIIVQGFLSWCRPLFFSLFFLSQLYALAASSFFSLSFPFFFLVALEYLFLDVTLCMHAVLCQRFLNVRDEERGGGREGERERWKELEGLLISRRINSK